MNKECILLVFPYKGWLNKGLVNEGYNLSYPYHGNSIFLRIIREIHFRYIKIAQSIWYNRKNRFFYGYIVLSATLITPSYIRWLKKNNPDSKIILLYPNLVDEKRYNPNDVQDSLCVKWTFDKNDAKKYNMNLFQGGMYLHNWVIKEKPIKYDVFYVGKDKKRLNYLRSIEKEINAFGLKTMFYITWERNFKKKDDGIHKPFLPYEKVLDYIGESKAILHLIEGAQDGVTIRIQEALIHRKKLITDDKTIVNYDFYDKNNIFILGKDNINELKEFLNSPYKQKNSEFYKHSYYDQMLQEMITTSFSTLQE